MTDPAPPYSPPEDLGFIYITDEAGLREAVEALQGTSVLAVDTESDSFYSYEESCCLVQMTGDSGPDYVVDPLKVKDLSALGDLMADPSVVKIFHGADYDVVSLKRDFGFTIAGIFDTMIAAQAGGHERFGLGDLVKKYFGVTLNKKYQRHDWSSRPLKPEHLAYARLDSHFLPKLRTILFEKAVANGREAMLEEEFKLLEAREWSRRPLSPDDCMKMKGARGLDPDERRVLRAVFLARDERARARNRPPFKVWGNEACLKVAQAQPRTKAELGQLLGPTHHVVRRYATEVVDAVAAGLEDTSPPPKVPKPTEPSRAPGIPPFTRDDEPLLSALKKWRNQKTRSEKLAPGMIVNNAIMRTVAALKPKSLADFELIADMRDWQRAAYADDMLAIVTEWVEAEAQRQEKRAAEGTGRKRRRRRRKKRPQSSEAGGEGGGAEQNEPTAASPE